MGRTYKTEAVVLRSFRFGEADRVLHLYTLDRGRIGAVAKGARKTKSRFGARLARVSPAAPPPSPPLPPGRGAAGAVLRGTRACGLVVPVRDSSRSRTPSSCTESRLRL